VAHESPVSVMFPMVSTIDELLAARAALDEAISAVGSHSPPGLQVGVMVEVPALALKAPALTAYVDFFSIGTNDLTQYTLAVERGNEAVAALADPLDPGVLRLIQMVCQAAGDRTLVAVCGELAADPVAVPLLVGLGVRELSVSPAAIPMIKEAVRSTSDLFALTAVQAALEADGAAAVRRLVAPAGSEA
jgi:phosphoenolpyruvate-protein kinase (PTS system EI component)